MGTKKKKKSKIGKSSGRSGGHNR